MAAGWDVEQEKRGLLFLTWVYACVAFRVNQRTIKSNACVCWVRAGINCLWACGRWKEATAHQQLTTTAELGWILVRSGKASRGLHVHFY